VFFLAGGIFFPFLSYYLKIHGYSGSQIGLIFAAGSVGSIFVQPFLGMLTDRADDYRSVIKAAAILSCIAVFGFLYIDSFAFIVLVNVVMTIVSAPLIPVVDSIAVEQAPNFGFNYGQVRVWGAAGWSAMTFVSGAILEKIGYDQMFLCFAILNLGLIAVVFSFPKLPKQEHEKPKLMDGFKTLMRNPTFVYFAIIGLLYQTLVAINLTYLPIFYQHLHYPMAYMGWNFAIAAVIEIPLFLIIANVIRRTGLFPLMALGVLMFAIKYFIMSLAPSLPLLLTVQLLDGIGFAVSISAALEIVNLLAPDRAKATAQTVFGAITGLGGLAGIIGNLAGGFIFDQYGPEFMYGLMAGVALLAAILLVVFPNKKQYHL
jgi:PPP family 3-phenylpropionic acid transporter